ncbi:MAG: hypothetical protein LBQ50_02195 [Planctomycetaceae bacterium]|jgi:hypothetical protein|nr:hypothetical protein [Planctomycetaceae bacterium]
MKKKLQKSVQRKWTLGVVGLLALGLGSSLCGAEPSKVPIVRHELVPHVVLPETIQYNKVAKNLRSQPGLSMAGDYGMVSPYVATYLPFPSYQIPFAAEMRGVNQSVYPVVPQRLPLPAKKAVNNENENRDSVVPEKSESKLVLEEKESSFGDTDVAPILLASNSEEVIQAAPLNSLSNEVTQTGIFCVKPPKPPTAWSFSSPIFKAASMPMGVGSPNSNSFINQFGPRGCTTQLGYQSVGGEIGNPAPYPPFPMNPMNQGVNAPQFQLLPNGMLLMTVPPDHSRCGLIRCNGHSPRMILLPGAPGIPQPPQMAPPLPGAMMPGVPGMPGAVPMQAQYPMPYPVQQPQFMPVMAMTPYGATIVGYQPIPATNPFPAINPFSTTNPFPATNLPGDMRMYGMGMGMMTAQQLQALQIAQQSSGISQQSAEEQDEAGNELKVPLPINSQATPGGSVNPYPYAIPYSLYAQQFGAAGQTNTQENAGDPTNPLAMSPMLFAPPQVNYGGFGNPYGVPYSGVPYPGVCMTPYGMMAMPSPMSGYGNGNGFSAGYGVMPVGMQPAGFPGQGIGANQGGLNMSDVVQLMMLLNNNQKRRPRLFERLAERRELRRERHSQNDPLNQLMQAWTTPYMSAADSAIRMPSRNAYPYGYFGAQVGQQDTANYGGYYNLYMGNTSYPGLY